MDWESRKTPLMGLIGGLGVVAFLVGVPGGFYSLTTAILLALAIWIIGPPLINVLIPCPLQGACGACSPWGKETAHAP